MRDILTEWNPWWNQEYHFEGVVRDKLEDVDPWIQRRELVAILGVRRCGKTTFLYEVISKLINELKIDPKDILFIKADDDRLEKESLIDVAIDEHNDWLEPKGKKYIFIDEIQEIEGWHKTIKRIYDLRNDVKIFLSGSNASLLKEELGTTLAGRFAFFEMFPFSFKEFLRAKGIKGNLSLTYKRISPHLQEYLRFGGFPEVVLENEERLKKELIGYYFDSIFYRDIIKRKNLRNPSKIEKLVKYFLQNISNLSNYSKIGKLLSISTDSVGEYVKALEDAYLIFASNLFDFSYKKQIINPKKIYCVDAGIRNMVGFAFSADKGRLFENIVYVALRRQSNEILYYANKKECDFIVKKDNTLCAIQVCQDLKNCEERELEGLREAMTDLGIKKGVVITENEEKKIGKIRLIPLWKWLLDA